MAERRTPKKNTGSVRRGKMDIPFFAFVLILLTTGLVMLFSSSYVYSYAYYGNSYRFILRQGMFAVIGVIAMLALSRLDYRILRKFAWLIYGGSVVLLLILLIFPPMVSGMDVKRWFVIGPLNFQPSEIAKFAVILLLSSLISAKQKKINELSTLLFLLFLIGLVCVLIIAEPHLSATILVLAISVVLLVVGGLGLPYILGGAGIAVGGIILAITTGLISYGSDRIRFWLNPWAAPKGEGYQTIQSLLAIGSGGIMGRGIGQSRQKHLWVPEPHNDFIFSIVCEELGLIGAMVIIVMFALLVWRGFTIALRAPDRFGSLMAIGLTVQVGLQAMLNIFVVTNTMPNTGISLPFFSYGGTSLVLLLAQMGIVLSVSRSSRLEKG
ncbi:MAG: putative lipid II flippase FtsW [Clostridia bacterium]|nr:putative lipid II flippase FtsW [Clostridia bacterium]